MVDTWATVGSCAQIGRNVHLSGGVGIGGVLEPLQANPTIIEDNCFIGARSEVVEGVIVEENSVLGMGVFIGQSTKIYNRDTGEVSYGRVPSGSVVVAGSLPFGRRQLPAVLRGHRQAGRREDAREDQHQRIVACMTMRGMDTMSVSIKNADEIEKMRIAGRLASELLDFLTPHVQAGRDHGRARPASRTTTRSTCRTSMPATLNYAPPGHPPVSRRRSARRSITSSATAFPATRSSSRATSSTSTSPSSRTASTATPAACSTSARPRSRRSACARSPTRRCGAAFATVRPGAHLGDIGATIQRHAEGHGFSVVREFCGHGIGRQFHEEPQVLHYGRPGTGLKLQPGMIFTIEPMINAGRSGHSLPR